HNILTTFGKFDDNQQTKISDKECDEILQPIVNIVHSANTIRDYCWNTAEKIANAVGIIYIKPFERENKKNFCVMINDDSYNHLTLIEAGLQAAIKSIENPATEIIPIIKQIIISLDTVDETVRTSSETTQLDL